MKIALLCSGGVDSTLALHLLKQQGHEITAFYLKIWLEDELDNIGRCPWQEDLKYVEESCALIGVPYQVISLQQEYHQHIISYILSEVQNGRTPNPDLLCNQYIKFGAFLDKLASRGFTYDKVATGHYALIQEKKVSNQNYYELLCAKDSIKDQTYFLSHLHQNQLARALFPLGSYSKAEVRQLAEKAKLPSAQRKDSQGLCFLGKIRFSDFLQSYIKQRPGELVEYESNIVIGKHPGFWLYTIGQRQGLGLSGGPWYVVSKNPKSNRVYVSRHYYSPDKRRDCFYASSLHWIGTATEIATWLKSAANCSSSGLGVKLRHGSLIYPCLIRPVSEDKIFVSIEGNDQGIASGQFAVFYQEKRCLGCAVIDDPALSQSQYTSFSREYVHHKLTKSDAYHQA